VKPYYERDGITIYHGDCLEISAWAHADVIVTDPPYGIRWKRGARGSYRPNSGPHRGIWGDDDVSLRDAALAVAVPRPGLVFGSFYAAFPIGVKQVLVYHKPSYAGLIGANTPFRRDVEPIFLIGDWPAVVPTSSSVFHARSGLNGSGISTDHPHTKPISVMLGLMALLPPGVVADPFMGSGSTLVAAERLGRRAIGIEIEERYCEIAAKRLSQRVMFGVTP